MSEDNSFAQLGPYTIIAEWEGPAIPASGVMFDEKQAQNLSETDDIGELAAWITVTAFPEVPGSEIHAMLRKKVLGVLSDLGRKFGPSKIDEIKLRVFQLLQKYRRKPEMTDERLNSQISRLFDQIPA